MSFGHSQKEAKHRHFQSRQAAVYVCDRKYKARVQSSGLHCMNLLQRTHRLELQLSCRLLLPELAERIGSHPMPGYAFHEPSLQCPRLPSGHALRAHGGLANLLKNLAGILEKQSACLADLYAAWKSLEEFETDLLLQLLNLARKRRLSHAKTLCSSPVMLLLSHRDEISEMSQFH